jgi:hypothetical protein
VSKQGFGWRRAEPLRLVAGDGNDRRERQVVLAEAAVDQAPFIRHRIEQKSRPFHIPTDDFVRIEVREATEKLEQIKFDLWRSDVWKQIPEWATRDRLQDNDDLLVLLVNAVDLDNVRVRKPIKPFDFVRDAIRWKCSDETFKRIQARGMVQASKENSRKRTSTQHPDELE